MASIVIRREKLPILGLVALLCSSSSAENISSSDVEPSRVKIPLYISGMFSMTVGWDGSGVLPAVELALEQINGREDVLEDYDLRLVWDDSKCVAGTAPRILFDHIFTEPTKVIILGAACSPNTQAVAGAAQYWNLLTISYSSTSPALSDRVKYPYFYRTVPLENAIYNPPRLWFMKHYGWRRVGIIYENREVFERGALDLMDRILKVNGSVVTEVVDKEARNQLERLKNENIRIIVVYSYEIAARRIFCEAYKVGLYGPGVFWSIAGWYESEWWLIRDGKVQCTAEEMSEVVELSEYTALDVAPISYIEKKTVGGITPQEFRDTMNRRITTWPKYKDITSNNYMSYAYDATWAIALMLNRTARRLKERAEGTGILNKLEDFTYVKSGMRELFNNELAKTDFFGASGSVRFVEGERIGNSLVSQLQGVCSEGWTFIGRYCYLVNTTLADWMTSKRECAARDAYLIDAGSDAIEMLEDLVMDHLDVKWHVNKPHSSDKGAGLPTNTSIWSNGTGPASSGLQCPYFDREISAVELDDCYDASKPFVCQAKAKFKLVDIAVYDAYEDDVIWTNEIKWPGGVIPNDGLEVVVTRYDNSEDLLPSTVYIIFCTLAGVVIFSLTLIFIFDSRFILENKLYCFTSPYVSVIIVIGFVLMVGAIPLTKSRVLAHISDDQYLLMCKVKTCVISVGYTLVIGTMIARTWRAYKQHLLKYDTVMSNNESYIIIAMLTLIDALCVILMCVAVPSRITDVTLGTTEIFEGSTKTIQRRFVKVYAPKDLFKSSLFLLGDKFVFLLAGSYLAFEVSKVKLSKYDDCKSFVWGVYNFLLCSICGCFLGIILRDDQKNQFILTSSLILVHCTVATAMFCGPRLWMFFSDRQRNEIIDHLNQQIISQARNTSASTEMQRYAGCNDTLIEENIRLTKQLEDLRRRCLQKYGRYSDVWKNISHNHGASVTIDE